MATPAQHPITLYRGDDFDELTFYIRDPDGVVEPLPEGTVARADLRDQAGDYVASFTVTVEDNRVRVFMPGSVTSGIDPGSYRYDVQLRNADGSRARTPIGGKAKVVGDVTR